MGTVTVEENESIDKVLKRFKKECQKSGIPMELRRREHYEKPSVKRKRKIEAAKRKARRRMLKMRRKLEAL
jgi:small subunit ribosomal protein S21